MKDTYWNNNGRFEKFAAALQELIPAEGAVKNPAKNKCLERFRKAVNCYYDLYNNGLCNRKAAFSKMFNISANNEQVGRGRFSAYLYEKVERKMDQIILDAYAEQFPEKVLAAIEQVA